MPEEEDYKLKYDEDLKDEEYLDPSTIGKKKRPWGPKNSAVAIEKRCQRLYMRQLNGHTGRQLVFEHAEKEGIARSTAWRDWKRVQEMNSEDFKLEREQMGGRIFSMRNRLFNSAMRRGQLQTAAHTLDALAKMVGCDQAEEKGNSVPDINIKIERE
jgi:hypothetical protein